MRQVHLLQQRAKHSDRVSTGARGCLHEVGVPLTLHCGHDISRQQHATIGLAQICLAAYHGDGRALADPLLQNLVAEPSHLLEGPGVVYRVHEGERVTVSDAKFPHGREGVTPARVQDLQTHLTRNVVLQHVKLLDCARVLVLEAVAEKTVDERGLTDPRSPEEHQPDRVRTPWQRHADLCDPGANSCPAGKMLLFARRWMSLPPVMPVAVVSLLSI